MKITFLTTDQKELVKVWVCQESSPASSLLPPVDLVSIATQAKKSGAEVKVLDLRLDNNFDLQTFFASEKPDLVVLNITTTSAHWDYLLIKKIPPSTKVIAFGTHAQSNPMECFANNVNAVMVGDPELVIEEIIRSHLVLEICRGLILPNKTQAIPLQAQDLDQIEIPDLSLIDLHKYHAPYIKSGNVFTILLSSRGCPFKCTYCLYPTLFGAKARAHSVARLIKEIEINLERFNVREFYFLDATFNLDVKRIEEFCQRLIEKNLGVSWMCNMRVTPLSENMLSLMKKAGCRWIFFGVEDQDLLSQTKKGTSTTATETAFKLCKKVGIQTIAFTMVFPREDQNEKSYAQKVASLLARLEADAFQCNIAIPFPGTELFEEYSRQNLLDFDWRLYDPHGDRLPYKTTFSLPNTKKRIYRDFLIQHPIKVYKVAKQMSWRAFLRISKYFIEKNLVFTRVR